MTGLICACVKPFQRGPAEGRAPAHILSDLRAVRLLSEVQGPVFREEWLLLFSSVHSAGPRDGASHWIDSELEVTDYAWSA